MKRSVPDFIQFSGAIANFYFFKGDWVVDYVCTQFRDFTKISLFFKSFYNSWGNSYIQFVVILI